MAAKDQSAQAVTRNEHDVTTEAKRVIATDPFGGVVTSGNFQSLIDKTTTPGVIYIGLAQIGSATSGAVWQIQRIDTSGVISTTWADDDDFFDNIWDNHVTIFGD